MERNIVEETSLVPRIRKEQFDDVATEFLTEYCPEALQQPMAVPIMDIARHKMGLRIISRFSLSEDFSVYGMICFTSGLVPVYDKEEDEFTDKKVRIGTILIDKDVLEKRNVGCLHNTVAHECVHWYKHRNYHLFNSGMGNDKAIAYRYPIIERDETFQDEWDDEDWMEWQANGIAPRILMPRQTFAAAVERVCADIDRRITPRWAIVKRLADLYEVSKQSADIRCDELGIDV